MPKKIPPEAIAEWDALLNEGMPYKAVGEATGYNPQTVSKYLPGRGWTYEQMGTHSQLIQQFDRLVG